MIYYFVTIKPFLRTVSLLSRFYTILERRGNISFILEANYMIWVGRQKGVRDLNTL